VLVSQEEEPQTHSGQVRGTQRIWLHSTGLSSTLCSCGVGPMQTLPRLGMT